MKRLLYVDDDPCMLRATARALKPFGWEVVPKAFPKATPTELLNVSCVLTDWQPHGPAAVAMAEAAGLPVVVYTGAPDSVPDTLLLVVKGGTTAVLDDVLCTAVARRGGR